MLLFNSIVFGAFVGFLVHFWLTVAEVKPKIVLIVAIIAAVLVAALVDTHHLLVF